MPISSALSVAATTTGVHRRRVRRALCAAELAISMVLLVGAALLGAGLLLASFDELLRVIDSLQLTAKHKVATPVNWQQGDKVIISGSVSNDEAKETYPDGWEEPRPYIRIVPQPQ